MTSRHVVPMRTRVIPTVLLGILLLTACGSDDTDAASRGDPPSAPAAIESPDPASTLKGTWETPPLSMNEGLATVRKNGLGKWIDEFKGLSPLVDDTVLILDIGDDWDLYRKVDGGPREELDYDAAYSVEGDQVVVKHSVGSNTFRWAVTGDTLTLDWLATSIPASEGVPEEVFQRALYMTSDFVRVSPQNSEEATTDDDQGQSQLELTEGVITQSDADYTTRGFRPRTTFHTPDLAYPLFPELDRPRGVLFGTEVGALAIVNPATVFDPASGRPVDAPGDLTEWATSNDHVKASAAEPVTIAGAGGMEVTAEVVSVGAKEGDCDEACIRFAAITPEDSIWFLKGDRLRLISLDVGRDEIGIVVVSDRAGFAQINQAANKLLKTLRFHP